MNRTCSGCGKRMRAASSMRLFDVEPLCRACRRPGLQAALAAERRADIAARFANGQVSKGPRY